MQKTHERIILGIDPGTNLMGFGIIQGKGKNPGYIDMGVIDLKKAGDPKMNLRKIYEATLCLF